MQADLESIVNDHRHKLFVGIGNVLKSDDGIGVYIALRIHERETVRVLVVEVSIENYIGRINKTQHDILILIDAVDFQKEPGYYRLLSPDEIMDYTTNTHNISVSKLPVFFKSPLLILGIQPESVSLGEGISDSVKKQADRILEIINAT